MYGNLAYLNQILSVDLYGLKRLTSLIVYVFYLVFGFIVCYLVRFNNTAYPSEFYKITGRSVSSSTIYLTYILFKPLHFHIL